MSRFITIEFKPNEKSRVWRRASIQMHNVPEARKNLHETGTALAIQEGWFAWRIVDA